MSHRYTGTFSALAMAAMAGTAGAQDGRVAGAPPSIEDPNIKQTVAAAAIRYGRLVLLGAESGQRYTIPTSVYASENGATMTILDGRLTSFTQKSGSMRKPGVVTAAQGGSVQNAPIQPSQGTGSTGGAVQGFVIDTDGLLRAVIAPDKIVLVPDGVYRSEDGKKTVTIAQGKPSQFLLPYVPEPTPTQTSPVAAPIRR